MTKQQGIESTLQSLVFLIASVILININNGYIQSFNTYLLSVWYKSGLILKHVLCGRGIRDMCVCVWRCWVCSAMSKTLRPHGLKPKSLLHPWNFPGKNTEVGCHFLLEGIFLTQGSNPHLLYWQVDSLSTVSPGKLHGFYSNASHNLWGRKMINK